MNTEQHDADAYGKELAHISKHQSDAVTARFTVFKALSGVGVSTEQTDELVSQLEEVLLEDLPFAVRPPLRTSLHAQQRPAPQKCHRALPTPTCEQSGYNPRGPSRVRDAAMR